MRNLFFPTTYSASCNILPILHFKTDQSQSILHKDRVGVVLGHGSLVAQGRISLHLASQDGGSDLKKLTAPLCCYLIKFVNITYVKIFTRLELLGCIEKKSL